MTDERIDDLVARAAKVRDADLRTPATRAAVRAAMEDLIDMEEHRAGAAPDEMGPADDPTYVVPGSGGGRRPRGRILVTTAAAVLVVAAVVGLVALQPGDDPEQRSTPAATETEAPATSAPVAPTTTETVPEGPAAPPADAPLSERIVHAHRAAYAANIVLTVTHDDRYGGTVEQQWFDDLSGTWRSLSTGGNGILKGEPVLDDGPAAIDGATATGQRSVDYCFREYTDSPSPGLAAPGAGANVIERGFGDGTIVEDGRELLDGRETIRLRNTAIDETIWIDATTLLPVRTAGDYDGGGSFVATHEFIPRTPESQQVMVPPIPEGFTKVDQVRGDGASLDRGCWEATDS